MLSAIDFYGLGATEKKKDPVPPKPVEKPTPPVKSSTLLPKWTPLAAGAVMTVIVIGILLTSKGKD